MIKCEVIKQFNFARFDELKNIKRKSVDIKGKLLVGDEFECTKEIAEYLAGKNPLNEIVVKVIEVEPVEEPKVVIDENVVKEIVIEPKKTKKKKK